MKKLLYFSVIGVLALFGCQKRPDNTIKNLQLALVNEVTADARYTAYSLKAQEEGFGQVAKLFEALARSEKVHTERIKEFLDELNVSAIPIKPAFIVGSTRENLIESIKLEKAEADTFYNRVVTEATLEKLTNVAQTINYALLSEQKHLNALYNTLVLLRIKPDSLKVSTKAYSVCPICGNTYELSEQINTCTNCGTIKELFIQL
jgi:rubrerythrin